MVKFLCGKDSELIFNYLDKDLSALLSCITEYYPDSFLESGVFAMQYIDGLPVSLSAFGGSFSLLFSSCKADLDELLKALKSEIHSPNELPFLKVGEYFLLKKVICKNSAAAPQAQQVYGDFKAVIDLSYGTETINLQYLFKKGRALPAVLSRGGEIAGGGLIVNSDEYSVISHIFVKERYRGKGAGTAIVNNLLSLADTQSIYLISEKINLDFYGKLGFSPVLTVNKYRSDV